MRRRIVDFKQWGHTGDTVYGGICAPARGLTDAGLEALRRARSTRSGNEFRRWGKERIRIVSQPRGLLGEAQLALKEPAWA